MKVPSVNHGGSLSRDGPAIAADTSVFGQRGIRDPKELAEGTGMPEAIREVITVDNVPKFSSKAMPCWAEQRRVVLCFIRPR